MIDNTVYEEKMTKDIRRCQKISEDIRYGEPLTDDNLQWSD